MKCALRFFLSSIDDFVSLLFLTVLPGGPCLVAACLHAHTMMSIRDISSLSFSPSERKHKQTVCKQILRTYYFLNSIRLLPSRNMVDGRQGVP